MNTNERDDLREGLNAPGEDIDYDLGTKDDDESESSSLIQRDQEVAKRRNKVSFLNQQKDSIVGRVRNQSIKLDYTYKKAGLLKQTYLMTRKNFKIMLGKFGFIFVHLFTIILVNLLILFINYLTKYSYDHLPAKSFGPVKIGNIKKCVFSKNCKELGYIVVGKENNYTKFTMEHVAKKNNLTFGDNIVKLYVGQNVTKGFQAISADKDNEFSTIVILCTGVIQLKNYTYDCRRVPTTHSYWVLYNSTLVRQNFLGNFNQPLKLNMYALRTAQQFENAIANWIVYNANYTDSPEVEHVYSIQNVPETQNRFFNDFDTASENGTIWFFIPIMVSFLIFNSSILKEKEKRLRQGMAIFGVNSLAYLSSWIFFSSIFNVFFILVLLAIPKLLQYSLFVNCPFYIYYISFYCAMIAFNGLSLFLTSVTSNDNSGSKLGYAFMLICLFLQSFMSQDKLLKLMYTNSTSPFVTAFQYVLCLVPSYHFVNILENIIKKAGNKFDYSSYLWVKGSSYNWDDFTSREAGKIFNNTVPFQRPSPFESCIYLVILAPVFYLIVFVTDNIVSSNRGFTRNPLKVIFNLCRRVGVESDESRANSSQNKGIVLKNISKSYLMKCNRKGKNSDWALKNVNMIVREGELFGLLGPNGAGKTTMIGLLSGILNPTSGEFYSSGLNGRYQSGKIRMITNVCPQFDILWDDLSIYDHINLICGIKGLKGINYRDFAYELMSAVNLGDSLDEKISNLSGGMKRRVSIAMATIGNPKILIFDEPTTGLDPENRQDIWGFINKLKQKGRTILLTTHILEEADALSDRISIMNYGRVKVTGTSAELKRKIGAGFKLNIIMNDYTQEKVDKISNFVKEHAPSSNLLDFSGGALLFVIPFKATHEITKVLKEYEKREDLSSLVDDLAVSNSTLEEVFIEVTKGDPQDKLK